MSTETLPSTSLYWAVLETTVPGPTHSARADSTDALDALLELVPSPADDLFAVFAPLPDRRTLACAAPCELIGHAAHTLHPDTLPDLPELANLSPEVRAQTLSLLNFRTGPFQPHDLRSQKNLRGRIATLSTAGIAIILSLGFLHRAHQAQTSALAIDTAATASLTSINLTPETLRAELDRLRAAAANPQAPPFDAATALASLLQTWPTDLPEIHTDSLVVTPTQIRFSIRVPAGEQELSRRFIAPPGWTLHEPALLASDSARTISFRMTPAPGDRP